jgi:MSHA biogenesis protein MshI
MASWKFWQRKAAVGGPQVGLDIRPNGIAVARTAQVPGGKPVLDLCEFRKCEGPEHIPALLKELIAEYKLNRNPCNAIIRAEHYNLMQVEAPEVPANELKQAVRWRVKDVIDFHIDDAVIDVFEVPSQRNQRMKLLYVVVSKAANVKGLIDLLEGNGITLNVIDIPELVLRNIALLTNQNPDKSVALLYIGETSGKILISKGSTLVISRSIDVGVDALIESTSDFDQELLDAGIIPDEMVSILDTLVLELQRSLDYYDSNWPAANIMGTFVLPMEKQFPALLPHIFNTLGGVTQGLDLKNLVTMQQEISPELQAKCLMAVGASLRQEATAA